MLRSGPNQFTRGFLDQSATHIDGREKNLDAVLREILIKFEFLAPGAATEPHQ